ncbi:MAG: phage holin family protein [Clostridia bacterium]
MQDKKQGKKVATKSHCEYNIKGRLKIEEFITQLTSCINSELLFIVPALVVVGIFIKRLKFIPNKFIPLILLALGEIFSILFLGFNVQSTVQGILLSGASVFSYELYRQIKAKKE